VESRVEIELINTNISAKDTDNDKYLGEMMYNIWQYSAVRKISGLFSESSEIGGTLPL
jgi:hypothetical protein